MLDRILKTYLQYLCGEKNVEQNADLRRHTTFRIGGPARFFIKATSKQILLKLISALNYIEYPYRIIGQGSNILFPDRGFDGVIIKPVFGEIVQNGNFLYADAGAPLYSVAKFAREHGLGGFEFAAGPRNRGRRNFYERRRTWCRYFLRHDNG